MKTNNYNEFDKLVLYVKRDKVRSIIEHYVLFGWEVESEKDNDQYEDIVDITFARPHKVENKDELQLLQVHMEERLNMQAKIDKHKHSKTKAIGLCLGTVILCLLTLSLLSFTSVINRFGLVWEIVLLAICVGLIVFEGLFLPKIYKSENKRHEEASRKLNAEINDICKRVAALTGGANEKL